jgi:hypothetical protein
MISQHKSLLPAQKMPTRTQSKHGGMIHKLVEACHLCCSYIELVLARLRPKHHHLQGVQLVQASVGVVNVHRGNCVLTQFDDLNSITVDADAKRDSSVGDMVDVLFKEQALAKRREPTSTRATGNRFSHQ